MILSQLEHLLDVGMPGFDLNSNGALALAPTLIHLTRGLVKHPKHGH